MRNQVIYYEEAIVLSKPLTLAGCFDSPVTRIAADSSAATLIDLTSHVQCYVIEPPPGMGERPISAGTLG